MKSDRHRPRNRSANVKLGVVIAVMLMSAGLIMFQRHMAFAQESDVGVTSESAAAPPTNPTNNESQAKALLYRVVESLAHGPAFDAKVRETVWTGGREVVGVGTYEQAGMGTGRYNLQVTMHDGDGKHRLQQISDGRLAWTRSEIAGKVALRRVDVGRLEQWVQGVPTGIPLSPRLQVGAWIEMLANFQRDYQLQVEGARLKGQPVWVITGELGQERRKKVMADAGLKQWPMLYPSRIRVAVQSQPDPKTEFGALIPIRIEFWSDPPVGDESTLDGEGRLITLVEIYSVRPIAAPSIERFRFENQDAEVNFTNDTDRYIQLYGVRLTERQRKQLRR